MAVQLPDSPSLLPVPSPTVAPSTPHRTVGSSAEALSRPGRRDLVPAPGAWVLRRGKSRHSWLSCPALPTPRIQSGGGRKGWVLARPAALVGVTNAQGASGRLQELLPSHAPPVPGPLQRAAQMHLRTHFIKLRARCGGALPPRPSGDAGMLLQEAGSHQGRALRPSRESWSFP